ncbi:MAG: RNA-guided pseudouridylation complex pseudouridine synthase subunit Cbf5 [Methanosphaera sp.]|uniref:RNA-guided pseudouridylation complex pseudouridine synthase subunit Cbf5 n=1 Tax=Methanosphaera sp. TaxID=2666342 RepID=UPI0025F928AA|nr:RNA-guided pseudouridylation complex pseudouridine synthase subunit Cbf5 [Methanosphaera sp.]MCI5866675.1 RNA-guided pseudouridylation complex pseudouridine synthase subunit Cbf5 [Methanosphaera sp.]MDD6535152.1 RNA-guided pseudouridylation complex pseudouridine synthase subunit Cbf5 [Methanosphaera sp.]MDY3955969.1 RNA-guided pseudouridylation complex pseudouridine synthase subunit Cbf5 [Methanosphaera sp.]
MADYEYLCEAETDYSYGCPPDERSIEEHIDRGIINLDKPSGPTSHEIDIWVKDIMHTSKTGHGGTLDPKVTGVLPVALNSATKALQLLLLSPKEYVCLMRLHKPIDDDVIRSVLDEFTGKIYQLPPVKSAVKRELRVRKVYEIKLLEIQDNQDVLFRVTCEAGTYIRKLCHDIGEVIGCGAHMAELRRTMAGAFKEDETLTTLQDVTDAYYFYEHEDDPSYLFDIIQPMENATRYVKKIYVKDSAVDAVCHGSDLANSGIVKLDSKINKNNIVAVMTLKDELLAIGQALCSTSEIITSDTKIVVDIQKVFILPKTYPMMWK